MIAAKSSLVALGVLALIGLVAPAHADGYRGHGDDRRSHHEWRGDERRGEDWQGEGWQGEGWQGEGWRGDEWRGEGWHRHDWRERERHEYEWRRPNVFRLFLPPPVVFVPGW